MRVIFLVLAIFTSQIILAKDYIVYEYKLEWPVFTGTELAVKFVADQDKVSVVILDTGSYKRVQFTPEVAERVSKSLMKANSYRKNQKSSDVDVFATEEVDGVEVGFMTSIKHGFAVIVKENSNFNGTLSLSLKESMEIAEAISDAKDKAEFLERSINL